MWPFSRKKAFKTKDDCLWYGVEALRRGAAKEAGEALAGGAVVVVAHFPASLDEAQAALREAGVAVERANGTFDVAGARPVLQRLGTERVLLALSEQLRARTVGVEGSVMATEASRPGLTMIAWERHPLRERDEVITRFAEEMNGWYACELGFHAALDAPPVSLFAGESTKQILQRLGMGPMDSIRHGMLSKSLERAQAKVAEKVRQDPKPRARSAAEWVEAWKLAQVMGA